MPHCFRLPWNAPIHLMQWRENPSFASQHSSVSRAFQTTNGSLHSSREYISPAPVRASKRERQQQSTIVVVVLVPVLLCSHAPFPSSSHLLSPLFRGRVH